jgi:hypothetical protein
MHGFNSLRANLRLVVGLWPAERTPAERDIQATIAEANRHSALYVASPADPANKPSAERLRSLGRPTSRWLLA